MSGYTPNVPTAGQKISQTQSPINNNFTVINNAFNVDHVNIQNLTNQGNHNKVTLVSQSAPATVAQGPILFSQAKQVGAGATLNEVFFEQATGDGSAAVQLTYMGNPVSGTTTGSSFLPGGVIMKWGQIVVGASPTTVTFANAFPNALFSVVVSINTNTPANANATINNAIKTGFQIFTTVTGVTHFWVAIGN